MRKFNPEVFINPDKFKQKISIDRIVADPKVSHRGVKRYKKMLAKGENLGTIIVIKHPREDFYAVVDGHHRYYAQLESGIKEINCAIIGNLSSFIFHLTKDGWFQPSKEFTDNVRIPILKFQEHLKQFLKEFLKNPEKFKKDFKLQNPLNKKDRMKKILILIFVISIMSGCIGQIPEPTTTTTVETTVETTTETTTIETTVETTVETTTTKEHNGMSTLGSCSTDNECFISGCNSEICQSTSEESMVSICVYNPPYPDDLGYECKCVDNKCMWAE
jgi:eight-cysteine-cluster-containing protein